MVSAFDADVLVYAAAPDHPLGRRVAALFSVDQLTDGRAGLGSLVLLPELLTKPTRSGATAELEALRKLLARLDLRPVDQLTAARAVALGATHRLRTADAIHLATAVSAGADRFITNNRRDLPQTIDDIDVIYPSDLPDPG